MFRAGLLCVVSLTAAAGPEILQKRCLSCHNPQAKMGGLSLASRADAARVLAGPMAARVSAGQMPPGGGLGPEEKQQLLAWLEKGAPWEGSLAAPSRPRAGRDWWSLQPLRPQSGSIDSFIEAKLRDKGLALSPAASKRTLLRRVYFDLTGLPPSPADVDAFLADNSPAAYERVVDRLLASPHYGERWGRHWMDVIRFGESHGYEQNHIRPTAWRFRDYLIRSFNNDVPYNRLILEHLAGDQVAPGNPDVEIGTAFLVAGPHDTVGNQAEAFKRQQRADDFDDMVNATASAFLGLTVNCAKCHDHKFDPILQKDYYRLASVFAGVHHAERVIAAPAQLAAFRAATAPLEARIKSINQSLDTLRKQAAPALPAAEKRVRAARREPVSPFGTEEKFAPAPARFLRFHMPANAPGGLDEIQVWTPDGRNVALGARVEASSTRVADGNPDAYHARFLTDGAFDKRWFAAPGSVPVTVTLEWTQPATVSRVSWSTDRLKAFQGRFQQPTLARYQLSLSTDGKTWTPVASDEGRLPDRAGEQERLFVLEALGPAAAAEFTAAEKELAVAVAALAKVEKPPRAYAGEFRQPEEPVYLLKGGNVMQRGEPVEPASLSALPGFSLPLDAPEAERRLALAKWIAADTNPLTPRVMANRLWHYHFGTGLVATPSDFGFNGERPSHPELLDYLAQRLIHYGWRLKPLHREILLSSTYRQSSQWNDAAGKADASARLLWRFPPQRLQAEAIRDNMLAVAGVLNSTIGGPSFSLYKYTVDNVATYFPLDHFGPETYRRAVYAQSARSIRTELLSVHDCPDSSLPEPRRVVTTSPLQALSLLNNSFTTDMAAAFAKRIAAHPDPVRHAFLLAFGRPPEPAETAAAAALVQSHGLPALARAILNTNEFVYVH
jgi:hypothetical protein